MGNFNSVTVTTHGSAMNKDKVELVAEGERVPNPTSTSTSGSGVASASAVKVKLEIEAEETLHDEIEVDANEADASAVGTEDTTAAITASSIESMSDESALKATANVNATIEPMKQYKYNNVREKLEKLHNFHKSYGLMKCWGIAAIELSQIDGVLCNILEDRKAKLLHAYKISMGSDHTSNSTAVAAAPDLNTATEQSVSDQYKALLEKLDSIHEMHMSENALRTSTDTPFSNDIATFEMNTIHDKLCRIIEDSDVKMQQQYCDFVDLTDDKTSDEESVNFDTKPPSKKRYKTEQLDVKPDSRTLSRGKYTPHSVEEAATIALEQRNTMLSVSDHRLATTSPAIKGEASKAPAQADGVSKKKNAGSEMPLKGKRKLSEGEEERASKKADQKRYRKICSAVGCTNIARTKKGGVCVRHGAKLKRCGSEGCTNIAVKGGVCVKHGAKVKRCSSEGCTNQFKKGGVCRRHGANCS